MTVGPSPSPARVTGDRDRAKASLPLATPAAPCWAGTGRPASRAWAATPRGPGAGRPCPCSGAITNLAEPPRALPGLPPRRRVLSVAASGASVASGSPTGPSVRRVGRDGQRPRGRPPRPAARKPHYLLAGEPPQRRGRTS